MAESAAAAWPHGQGLAGLLRFRVRPQTDDEAGEIRPLKNKLRQPALVPQLDLGPAQQAGIVQDHAAVLLGLHRLADETPLPQPGLGHGVQDALGLELEVFLRAERAWNRAGPLSAA